MNLDTVISLRMRESMSAVPGYELEILFYLRVGELVRFHTTNGTDHTAKVGLPLQTRWWM